MSVRAFKPEDTEAVIRLWQQYGLGKTLMGKLETRLAKPGCPKINLQVRSANQQVLTFYQSLGYQTDLVISLGNV